MPAVAVPAKSAIFVLNLILMNAEESVLIERVRNGDRAAFNELYGLYWVPLVNYAGLIVGDECAEDIVQEVFVRVWIGRERLRREGSLRGYLLRAVYRTSLNAVRSRNYASTYRSWVARQIEESCYACYDPDQSEVIRALYSRQLAEELESVVEQLPPKCREVFRMSHYEGLSNREIGMRLGISVSTVENHINNALRFLRSRLGHLKMLLVVAVYFLGR